MEEKPKNLDTLREILAEAVARDADLQETLKTAAADLLKDLGWGDGSPAWAEIKAGPRESQVTPCFVLQDKWLRGDLVFTLNPPAGEGAVPAAQHSEPPAPPPPPHAVGSQQAGPNAPAPAIADNQFLVNLMVGDRSKHTHEVSTVQQRSEAMIIDPHEQKDRDESRKKFAAVVFGNLESQIRERHALPPKA